MNTYIKLPIEKLQPLLDESEAVNEQTFVDSYISGVVRALVSSPESYRSFGAYWWALKKRIIARGIDVFGEFVESETLAYYDYESDAMACCAAYVTQSDRANANELFTQTHLLDIGEGETTEYTLEDSEMEKFAIVQRSIRASK